VEDRWATVARRVGQIIGVSRRQDTGELVGRTVGTNMIRDGVRISASYDEEDIKDIEVSTDGLLIATVEDNANAAEFSAVIDNMATYFEWQKKRQGDEAFRIFVEEERKKTVATEEGEVIGISRRLEETEDEETGDIIYSDTGEETGYTVGTSVIYDGVRISSSHDVEDVTPSADKKTAQVRDNANAAEISATLNNHSLFFKKGEDGKLNRETRLYIGTKTAPGTVVGIAVDLEERTDPGTGRPIPGDYIDVIDPNTRQPKVIARSIAGDTRYNGMPICYAYDVRDMREAPPEEEGGPVTYSVREDLALEIEPKAVFTLSRNDKIDFSESEDRTELYRQETFAHQEVPEHGLAGITYRLGFNEAQRNYTEPEEGEREIVDYWMATGKDYKSGDILAIYSGVPTETGERVEDFAIITPPGLKPLDYYSYSGNMTYYFDIRGRRVKTEEGRTRIEKGLRRLDRGDEAELRHLLYNQTGQISDEAMTKLANRYPVATAYEVELDGDTYNDVLDEEARAKQIGYTLYNGRLFELEIEEGKIKLLPVSDNYEGSYTGAPKIAELKETSAVAYQEVTYQDKKYKKNVTYKLYKDVIEKVLKTTEDESHTGDVVSHIYVRDDEPENRPKNISVMGDQRAIGIRTEESLFPADVREVFESSPALDEDLYFVGVYTVEPDYEIEENYGPGLESLPADVILAEPREEDKKPQVVIVDSLGRLWMERSKLGITARDEYHRSVRFFGGDLSHPVYETLHMLHDDGSPEDLLWTISFVRPTKIRELPADVVRLFNALPAGSREALAEEDIDLETELIIAIKTTSHGAVFKEYYDAVGRRVITEINGAVIFADTWNEDNEVTHAYKMARDTNIIFEYKTREQDEPYTFGQFIKDFLDKKGLLEQEGVRLALEQISSQLLLGEDSEVDLVEEIPWLGRPDERGELEYIRPINARPTILVMLPNDPRGRDIIRILPKHALQNIADRLLSDAVDWQDILINKWWFDGIPRSVMVEREEEEVEEEEEREEEEEAEEEELEEIEEEYEIRVQSPYSILPGRVIVHREYNAFRIEDRDYMGEIDVVRKPFVDGEGVVREYFEPLEMLEIGRDGERSYYGIRSAEGDETVETAYVHLVKKGGLLATEILTKEGTLAISIYDRQLVRLANGLLANLRYLSTIPEDFPSGIITLGQEAVHYDLLAPYQRPVFSLDATPQGEEIYDTTRAWKVDKPLTRCLGIEYAEEDDNQVESHRILEEHPLAPNLPAVVYIYTYINGELKSKEVEEYIDTDALGQAKIMAIITNIVLLGIPILVGLLTARRRRKRPTPPRPPVRPQRPLPRPIQRTWPDLKREIDTVIKSSSSGNTFGFDSHTASWAQHKEEIELKNLLRQGRTWDEIREEEFAEFRRWCAYTGRPYPVNLGMKEYLLKKGFIHPVLTNFRTTTPNIGHYLFSESLGLIAQGNEDDIFDFVTGELKLWAGLLMSEYGHEGSDSITKRSRMTFEDVNDWFQRKDFVDNYHTRRDEIARILTNRHPRQRTAQDRTRFKTYTDSVGPIEVSATWRRVITVVLGLFTSSVVGSWFVTLFLTGFSNALLLPLALGLVVALPMMLSWISLARRWNERGVYELPGPFRVGRGILSHARTHFGYAIGLIAFLTPVLLGVSLFVSLPLWVTLVPVGSAALLGILQKAGIILREERTVFSSDAAGEEYRRKKRLSLRERGERNRAIMFWATVLMQKLGWNVILFTYLAIPTAKFWIAAVPLFGVPTLGSLLLIAGLWSIFVGFFVVDIFAFIYFTQAVYGYFYAKYLGLGAVKTTGQFEGKLLDAKRDFLEHIVPEGVASSLPRDQLAYEERQAWEKVWERVLRRLHESEDKIDRQTRDKILRAIKESDPRGIEAIGVSIENEEARERLFYLVTTMMMEMPRAPDWDRMDSLTATITGSGSAKSTFGNEDDRFDLNLIEEEGITKFAYLVSRYQDEWENFCNRMIEKYSYNPTIVDFINSIRHIRGTEQVNIPTSISNKEQTDLTYDIEHWANMRFWGLYRNIEGLMYIREAFEIFAEICFPEGAQRTIARMAEEGVNTYAKLIEKLVDEKFQALSGARAEIDVAEMLERYPKLEWSARDGDYGCLYKARPAGEHNWKQPQFLEKAQLIHGGNIKTGKPESQNVFIVHIRGRKALFFDSNSATSLDDAVKIPMAMGEFLGEEGEDLRFINFREKIFTEGYNWKARGYAYGDRTWTTLVQRVISRFGAIGFYGHSTIIDTRALREFGTIPPDYVSEDLMLAIMAWLKGGWGTHREYLQFGKARPVDFLQNAVPFQKFSSGAHEMAVGRQMYRVLRSRQFNWWQKAMLVATLSFYYKKPVVYYLVPAYLTFLLFMGISGFVAFPYFVAFGLLGVLMSQAINLTGIYQLMAEEGWFFNFRRERRPWKRDFWRPDNFRTAGILKFAVMFPGLMMQFMAYIPIYYYGAVQGLAGGSQFYRTTKESWFLELGKRNNEFVALLNTSMKAVRLSLIFGVVSILGIWVWQSVAIAWSIFFLLSIFFWGNTPFMSRPAATPFDYGYKNWFKLLQKDISAWWRAVSDKSVGTFRDNRVQALVLGLYVFSLNVILFGIVPGLAMLLFSLPAVGVLPGAFMYIGGFLSVYTLAIIGLKQVVGGIRRIISQGRRQQYPPQDRQQLYPGGVEKAGREDETPDVEAVVRINDEGMVLIDDSEGLSAEEKELLTQAFTSWAEEVDRKNLDIPLLVTYNMAAIAEHKPARIEMNRTLLRAPPAHYEQKKTSPDTPTTHELFLRGILNGHECIHYLHEHYTEARVQQLTIEYYKAHPDIFDAVLETLNPQNINLIMGTREWFKLLSNIRAERAQKVAYVIPQDESNVHILADKDLNGKFRMQRDIPEERPIDPKDPSKGTFIHTTVKRLFEGEEVARDFPQYKPFNEQNKAIKEQVGEAGYIALINNNLYFNDGVVVFTDGVIYHADGEFNEQGFSTTSRTYTSFVTWKDGRKSIERLLYRKGMNRARDRVFICEETGRITEEITAEISSAMYGQKIVTDGTPIENVQTIAGEFADKGHLQKPYPHQMIGLDKYGNIIVAAIGGDRRVTEDIGMSVEEAAQYIRSLGAVEALLISNGTDVNMIVDDNLVTESGPREFANSFMAISAKQIGPLHPVCVLLVGPAAAGKGTSSKVLTNQIRPGPYGFAAISTGAMLRKAGKMVADGVITEAERDEAYDTMNKGDLVDDEIIMKIVRAELETRIREGVSGFIFDGMPRNEYQKNELNRKLEDMGLSVNVVIVHDVEDRTLEERRKDRIEKDLLGGLDDDEKQLLDSLIFMSKNERLYDVFVQTDAYRRFAEEHDVNIDRYSAPVSASFVTLSPENITPDDKEQLELLITRAIENRRPDNVPRKADIDMKAFTNRQNEYRNETLPAIERYSGPLVKHIGADVHKDNVPDIIEPAYDFAIAHAQLMKTIEAWDSETSLDERIETVESIARMNRLVPSDIYSLYHVTTEQRPQDGILLGVLLEARNFRQAMRARDRKGLEGKYYDVVIINAKEGPAAEELKRQVNSWRGVYYPEAAIVLVNEIPRDINKANLNALVYSIIETERRLRDMGLKPEEFKQRAMLTAAGPGVRKYPITLSEGRENKSLITSLGDMSNLAHMLKQITQFYSPELEGLFVFTTDEVEVVSSEEMHRVLIRSPFGAHVMGNILPVTEDLAGYGCMRLKPHDNSIEKFIEKPAGDVKQREFIERDIAQVPINWGEYHFSIEVMKALAEIYSRAAEDGTHLHASVELDIAAHLFEPGVMSEREWMSKERKQSKENLWTKTNWFKIWEAARDIRRASGEFGFVDMGREAIFGNTGNHQDHYEYLQDLLTNKSLQHVMGVTPDAEGRIIGENVRLGKDVVVEKDAIVLGHCYIRKGTIHSGAVVTNTLAEEIVAEERSMTIAVYQPEGKITSKHGHLTSDVFIDDKGQKKPVRIVIPISQDIKAELIFADSTTRSLFNAKVWPRLSLEFWSVSSDRYSFADLRDLFDIEATKNFLDVTLKASSAGEMKIGDVNVTEKWHEVIKQGGFRRRFTTEDVSQDEIEMTLELDADDNIVYKARNITKGQDLDLEILEDVIEDSELTKQFNPLRALRPGAPIRMTYKKTGKQDALSRHDKDCKFYCTNDRKDLSLLIREPLFEREIKGTLWKFYYNVSPYDKRGHLLAVPDITQAKERRAQELTFGDVKDGVTIARVSRNLITLYNSPHAGATVNHIHLQCVYNEERLAVENADFEQKKSFDGVDVYVSRDYHAKVLMFEGEDEHRFSETVFAFVHSLQETGIPFNLVFIGDKAYLFPRDIDGEVVEEFPANILASMELCGKFILHDRETHDQTDMARIRSAFAKINLSDEKIEALIESVDLDDTRQVPMCFVMVGGPCAGKGTSSDFLEKIRAGFGHISTGDLVRDEIAKDTLNGRKAKSYYDRGFLVPSELFMDIVESKIDEYIRERRPGIIFDGVPRDRNQAQQIKEMLDKRGLSVDVVMIHDVHPDTSEKRRKKRITEGLREGLDKDEEDELDALLKGAGGVSLYDAFIQSEAYVRYAQEENIHAPPHRSDSYIELSDETKRELEPYMNKAIVKGEARRQDIDIVAFNDRWTIYREQTLPAVEKSFRPEVVKVIKADVEKKHLLYILRPAFDFALAHAQLDRAIRKWDSTTTGNDKIKIIEDIARVYKISAVDTLSLYRLADRPTFKWRSQVWEQKVAEYQDDPTSQPKKVAAQIAIERFLEEKKQQLFIDDAEARQDITRLAQRIEPYWELRWLYTNTAVAEISPSARDLALDYILRCLEGNTGTGDVLWKNGEAVLTEIMQSDDERVWRPALMKAFHEEKMSSWENISESINLIRIEDNPELVREVVHFIVTRTNPELPKIWLTKKVIPEILARKIEEEDAYVKEQLEEQRNTHLRVLTNQFGDPAHSNEYRKALAYALGTSGDLSIMREVMTLLRTNIQTENMGTFPSTQPVALANLMARRSDIIKVLGMLNYQVYPTELRDELVWIVLHSADDLPAEAMAKARAASEVAAETLLDLSELGLSRPKLLVEADSRVAGALGVDSNYNMIRDKIIETIEEHGAITTLRNIVNSLMATGVSMKAAIETIEGSTGFYFDELINHMFLLETRSILRPLREIEAASADNVIEGLSIGKAISLDSNEGLLVVDEVRYEFAGLFPESHSNPIYRYIDPRTGADVLVKSGNDYSIMVEYIGYMIFALAGVPVPKMSVARDSDGKVKIILEHLGNYTGNMRRMPKRFVNDENITAALLLSALINDKDRTPWNMMFMKLPLNVTKSTIRDIERSRVMHIDFSSSIFSKPTSGFRPFTDGLYGEKTGNLSDFITTVRHDMKTPVNPAYARALENKAFMLKLARRLNAIRNEHLADIVKEAVRSIGYEDPEVARVNIQNWIKWSEIENKNGSWNRKPRTEREEPVRLFRNILANINRGGTLAEYLADMIRLRRDDIINKEFILRPALFIEERPFHRAGYEYIWHRTERLASNRVRYNFVAVDTTGHEQPGHLIVREDGVDDWNVKVFYNGEEAGEAQLESSAFAAKASSAGEPDMFVDDINISEVWRNMIIDGTLTRRDNDPATGDEIEISLVLEDDGTINYRARNITTGQEIDHPVFEEKIEGERQFIKELNPFEGFAEKTQFREPGRQPDMAPHSEECGFNCTDETHPRSMLKRKPVLEFRTKTNLWKAYSKRIFVDKRGHLVLIPDISDPRNRRPQMIMEDDISDVVDIASRGRKVAVVYNSPHAGASVDHIHFHIIYNGELVSMQKAESYEVTKIGDIVVSGLRDYGIEVIVLRGEDVSELSSVAFSLINRMQRTGIPYNLMVAGDRVYIIPRDIEHEVTSEYPAATGIRELYGKITVYNRQDFDYTNQENILTRFKKMSLTKEQIQALIDSVSTEHEIMAQVADNKKQFILTPNNPELLSRLTDDLGSTDAKARLTSALVLVDNMLATPEERLRALEVIREAERSGLFMRTEELKDRVDLHTHTYYSDGAYTPAGLVFDAWRQGMRAVGLVDHNTLDGLYEALRAGEILGIEVFAGSEIDVYDDALEMENFHIIGYLPTKTSAQEFKEWLETTPGLDELRQNLRELVGRYQDKNRAYIEAFNEQYAGTFELTAEDLKGYLTVMPNRYQLGKALYDKYGAAALEVKPDFRDATRKYFPFNMVQLVGRDGLEAEYVLKMITRIGGVGIMAHPGEEQPGKAPMYAPGQAEEALNKYAEYISGVEVYSSKHPDFRIFSTLIEKLNAQNPVYRERPLIVTIGSDAHDQGGILLAKGDARTDVKGNIPADVDGDKILKDLKSMMKSSSAGLIEYHVGQLMLNKGEFFGVDSIEVIDNVVLNPRVEVPSETLSLARGALIDVLRDDEAHMSVREMAAYALRLFADREAYTTLIQIAASPSLRGGLATDISSRLPEELHDLYMTELAGYSAEHQLAKALLNYRPTGKLAVEYSNQAVIVYSDALKNSIALQQLVKAHTKGAKRRFYLVNKEGISETALFSQLRVEGISEENFDHIIRERSADSIIEQLRPLLKNVDVNITQVRVFAMAEADLLAWSKQDIVEALVMILKDKRFEIISDLTAEHEEHIRRQEHVLSQA